MGFLVPSFLFLLSAILVTAAVPANNTTTKYDGLFLSATIGQEPRGRGTFGIVLSSTVTFIFCIWTAVHPNIIPGASMWKKVLYKAILMSMSILIPEAITMCSFGQWKEAKVLHKAWRAKMGIPSMTWAETFRFWEEEVDGFGLDVAFFVIMGGFVVDLPPPTDLISTTTTASPVQLPEGQTTTLTPHGFLKYLNEGYIHDQTFDRDAILDKGKSSTIAKLLATGQALWFMLQCVSRWVVGLPVSLLEIHVGIQVLCTGLLYGFWWSKPLSVDFPIKIVLRMKDGYESSSDPLNPTPPTTPLFSPLDLQSEHFMSDEQFLGSDWVTRSFITQAPPVGFFAIGSKANYDIVLYTSGDRLLSGNRTRKAPTSPNYYQGAMVILIGVLHASAWHSSFPTVLESWLWRGSSLMLCIAPLGLGVFSVRNNYHIDLRMLFWKMQLQRLDFRTWVSDWMSEISRACTRRALLPNGNRSIKKLIKHRIGLTITFSLVASYVIAILFITWESYASLRAPPDGTFLTPVWSNYWPHI